ncbi:MAG: hypothetical protein AAFV72_00045 [Cyanobacteria bacterium J06635_1]
MKQLKRLTRPQRREHSITEFNQMPYIPERDRAGYKAAVRAQLPHLSEAQALVAVRAVLGQF